MYEYVDQRNNIMMGAICVSLSPVPNFLNTFPEMETENKFSALICSTL